jgi:hypothetical protein
MKLATLAALSLLLSASYAFAGAGAPVPATPEGGPPSGKPGAILDDCKCKEVWSKAAGGQSELSADKAGPYVVNIQKVDATTAKSPRMNLSLAAREAGYRQRRASHPKLVEAKRQSNPPNRSG